MRLEGCLIHRLAGISMCSEPPDVDVKLDIVRGPRSTMSQVVEERTVSGDEIINVLEIYTLHIQRLRPFIVERR